MLYSSQREHFRQYVHIAGKGNVTVEYAVMVDRFHLSCKTCNEQLIGKESSDPLALDHSVQEWVRMHAHTGYAPNWAKGGHIEPEAVEAVKEAQDAKKIADLQEVTEKQVNEAKKYFDQQKAALLKTLEESQKKADEAWKQDMLAELSIKREILKAQLADLDKAGASKQPEALKVKEGRKFR